MFCLKIILESNDIYKNHVECIKNAYYNNRPSKIFRSGWGLISGTIRQTKIVYFATGEGKSISVKSECYKDIRRDQRFSLVANDTFHNEGEKQVFCSPPKGGKVRFSSLRCENTNYRLEGIGYLSFLRRSLVRGIITFTTSLWNGNSWSTHQKMRYLFPLNEKMECKELRYSRSIGAYLFNYIIRTCPP